MRIPTVQVEYLQMHISGHTAHSIVSLAPVVAFVLHRYIHDTQCERVTGNLKKDSYQDVVEISY